jgi:hypothetical protein
LSGFKRGPDDLSQALTAFTRAIRAHRRLARLAPAFFDSTEINRLAQRRKEDAEWRALWEPALERAYGSAYVGPPPDSFAEIPAPPKSSRTRRAVQRELDSWNFWIAAGSLAMARYRRSRPYALPSFGRIALLIEIAFKFANLACGSPAVPDYSSHAQALADLQRAYSHQAQGDSHA